MPNASGGRPKYWEKPSTLFKADFYGEFTQHAVSGVIAKLQANGYVSPHKLVIQGISRGALVAGLVAAQDTSISGVVLISGLYDLTEYALNSNSNEIRQSVLKSLIAETGGKESALRARSVLFFAMKIKAKTLILNGEKDDRTDPKQARRLAEEINHYGGNALAIIYPDYGHQIPFKVRNKEIDPFIDNILEK